jgi:hypothetical protein
MKMKLILGAVLILSSLASAFAQNYPQPYQPCTYPQSCGTVMPSQPNDPPVRRVPQITEPTEEQSKPFRDPRYQQPQQCTQTCSGVYPYQSCSVTCK